MDAITAAKTAEASNAYKGQPCTVAEHLVSAALSSLHSPLGLGLKCSRGRASVLGPVQNAGSGFRMGLKSYHF